MTSQVVLLASPALVWGQLVDSDSVSAWFEGIESLSGGAERFSTRRGNEPCPCPVEGCVADFDPEQRLRVTFRAPWRLLRSIELDVTLHPEEVGTRVDVAATYELRGLGALLRPLVRLRAEIALHRAARALRAAVDDESARRRKLRGVRSGSGAAVPARLSPSHEALLLRTAS